MTNMNLNDPLRIVDKLTRAGKSALLLVPLGLALSVADHHSALAQTRAAAPSCAAALDALVSEWQSIGYAEPGKPAQMIVSGRHGYTTTAGRDY
jgi:hypothetical protein